MAADFRDTLRGLLPDLYRFAFYVSARRDEALEHLQGMTEELLAQRETLAHAPNVRDSVFGAAARWLEQHLGRRAHLTFDDLDAVLRSDITRPIDTAMLNMAARMSYTPSSPNSKSPQANERNRLFRTTRYGRMGLWGQWAGARFGPDTYALVLRQAE